MNATRYTAASVHHILPDSYGGQQCLCGVVLRKNRDATEHIVDVTLADLRAKVEALHPDWLGTPADVLALLDEATP